MYNVRIIRSGDRLEIYKINDYAVNEGRKNKNNGIVLGKDNGSHGKQAGKDRIRNLTDARNNIIRLIKCNSDMNTFITLTFREKQDYKESKKSLNIMFTKLRKDFINLKYLWVLEYGERFNRLHYHLLCNIPIYIKLCSSKEKKSDEHKTLEREFALRYWNYGIVDIRQLQQEDNTNVALYVSTYIVKSLQNLELEGYRVYGYSRKTLVKPEEIKLYTKDSIEDILRRFRDYNVIFSNSYVIGYENYKGQHKGKVSYFDLKLKERGKNENK